MSSVGVFIQTNKKQLLGAQLAAYAIRRHLPDPKAVSIQLIEVDALAEFQAFVGKEYLRAGRPRRFTLNDLQSFTLTRFMPPQLMRYEGRALVIDPDVFALSDITPLLALDLRGNAIAACRKKAAWDTSVMLLDCSKLRHWSIPDLLQSLEARRLDYDTLMTLQNEPAVLELSREWNTLDRIDANTKLLHTTNRLTQPWKTGLPIDFTRNPLPRLLSVIPREPLHWLLGKRPSRYQRHPDRQVENFFFQLLSDAVRDGAMERTLIENEVLSRHVRADIQQHLNA